MASFIVSAKNMTKVYPADVRPEGNDRLTAPPLPLEAFNEKLVLQLVPVRRKKKKKKKRNNDDTKIVKSRISVFFAWRIEGRYKHVGLMYS